MGIYIIEGLPGHGKSTFATILASEWQQHYVRSRRMARRIYANFEMYLPCLLCRGSEPDCPICEGTGRGVRFVDDFLALRNLTDAIVIMDEAAQWFSGHNSRENQQFMGFFGQHRKDGNTLFLIAQSWASLDVTVRERTCEAVFRVKRLFGPNRWEEPSPIERAIGWWAFVQEFQARDYDTVTKRQRKGSRFIRIDAWHGRFDTLAKVGKIGEGGGRGAGLAGGVIVDRDAFRGEGVCVASEYTEHTFLKAREAAMLRRARAQAAGAPGASSGPPKRVITSYREYAANVRELDPWGTLVQYVRPVDADIDVLRRGGSAHAH